MDLDSHSPEFQRAWAKIVALSWVDPAFRARLVAQPAAVLREYGIEVADDSALALDRPPLSDIFSERLAMINLAQAAGAGTPPSSGGSEKPGSSSGAGEKAGAAGAAGGGKEGEQAQAMVTAATVVTTHASILPSYVTHATLITQATHPTFATHVTLGTAFTQPSTYPAPQVAQGAQAVQSPQAATGPGVCLAAPVAQAQSTHAQAILTHQFTHQLTYPPLTYPPLTYPPPTYPATYPATRGTEASIAAAPQAGAVSTRLSW